MRRRKTDCYFVEDRGFPDPEPALSYAQNLAMAWRDVHKDESRSFYVRDAIGTAFYRVDSEGGGVVKTYRLESTA
jgi:hypothetical protein